MNPGLLTAGANAPAEFNAIIEIPSQSGPVKYEVDKATGTLLVDRFMTTAMYYPCNYGYIPQTLSEDGDPADVLVITPYPLIGGAMITCRPVGILRMTDESGKDAKILAVPGDKISVEYRHIKETTDVSPTLLHTIEHFFTHYKDLEPNKWVKIEGWGNAAEAREEIKRSLKRYETQD